MPVICPICRKPVTQVKMDFTKRTVTMEPCKHDTTASSEKEV